MPRSPLDTISVRYVLPDVLIKEITIKLADEHIDARYSKKLLKAMGIEIDRGGVIRLKDNETDKYVLFATEKSPENNKSLLLGEGTSGKIKQIQNLTTGELKALKVLKNPDDDEEFKNEAKFLKLLGRGDGRIFAKKRTEGEVDRGKLYIIQDLVPGKNLAEVLMAGNLTLQERFDILLKVFAEIQKLHDRDFLHRDIKVHNFMVDLTTGTVTVVDFALMREASEPYDKYCGTRGYIAPEIGAENYSTASEVFALGRMVQEFFGIKVKADGEQFGILDYDASGDLRKEDLQLIKNLANKMLSGNPRERLSLREATQELTQISHAVLAGEEKTVSHSTNEQEKFIKLQLNKINKKIDPKILAEKKSLKEILRYAINPESTSAYSRNAMHEIKNKCLCFAKQAMEEFSKHTIEIERLHKIIEALARKAESLEHTGFFSRRSKNPSSTALMLRECADNLMILKDEDIDSVETGVKILRDMTQTNLLTSSQQKLIQSFMKSLNRYVMSDQSPEDSDRIRSEIDTLKLTIEKSKHSTVLTKLDRVLLKIEDNVVHPVIPSTVSVGKLTKR